MAWAGTVMGVRVQASKEDDGINRLLQKILNVFGKERIIKRTNMEFGDADWHRGSSCRARAYSRRCDELPPKVPPNRTSTPAH